MLFCGPSPHPSPLLLVSDQRKWQTQQMSVLLQGGEKVNCNAYWVSGCSSHTFAGPFHVDSRGGHNLCNLNVGHEGQFPPDSAPLFNSGKSNMCLTEMIVDLEPSCPTHALYSCYSHTWEHFFFCWCLKTLRVWEREWLQRGSLLSSGMWYALQTTKQCTRAFGWILF